MQAIDEQGVVGIVRGGGDRRPEQARKGFGQTAFADQAELGEHPVEPAVGLGGDAARPFEGALVDGPALDQRRTELGQRFGGILGGCTAGGLEGHDAAPHSRRRRGRASACLSA